jgi:nicotinamide-nucleotide amidase
VTEGDITEDEVTKSARALGRRCLAKRVVVATAESCTGGGVATAITRVSGSAKWFDRAFVTYSNDAKREMLGVRALTLRRHGAVSEEVAREMAHGALRRSPADICVSITGIAGPTGGSRTKPVGLVWFAWAQRNGPVQTRAFRFRGGRVEVRLQSVHVALRGLADLLR